MRKKRTNKAILKNKLWKKVREFVFIRDNNTCVHCYKHVEGSNRQPSHILGKGAYPRLEFNIHNVKTLCLRCHLFWWHRNPLEASEWFKEKYPDRYHYLNEMKKDQTPITELELEKWLNEVTELIKELR